MEEAAIKQNKNGTDVPKIAEPCENDPCIEFKNSSSDTRFFKETEQRLCEKTGLSRKGLYYVGALLVLSIVLFITVVALAASWPRRPHYQQFPICNEPACLRAAAQVQESWNSTVPPCENVWGWACNGWLDKHPLPPDRSKWNKKEELSVEEAARVRDLITTIPLPVHTGTVEWKMKHLYEGCLDMDNVNADQARPLTTIISELGGWYILRDWNMEDFDPNFILKQLHVKYGVSPYFKVSVQPNPRLPGTNSITISPSGLGLPDRTYYYTNQDNPVQVAYKQLIRDVVTFLTVAKTDAEKFGEDMFYYEKRIAEITPHSFDILNPVNTYNPVRLSELTITVANLPLQDILTAMFPESNITEETEVIVTSLDYLTKVSQIVATTDRATLNSYVIWNLARKYLPYLSTQFTSTLDLYNVELLGIKQPLQRWEKCARLVQTVMGLAVESAFESKNPIKNKTQIVIERIFQEIRDVVKERLKKYQSYSQLYKYLSTKIKKLKLQIGLPHITQKEYYIKQYYSKLIILKANLFESFKNGLIFKRKIEERLLTSPHPQDKITSYTVAHPQAVTYASALNTVVVPKAALSDSVFEDTYPSSILYGRLGISIAHAVISSILPYESAWNADLKLLSPFHLTVNESHSVIQDAKMCLTDFIINHKLISENIAELTTLSTIKHMSAVSVAHQALQKHLEGHPHVHQPSLEKLEDSALFFLTYAQSQCSVSTKQQELFDNLVNYELTQKALVQAAWSQVSEFPASLECKQSSEQCSDIF